MVAGATGLVGQAVLALLLADKTYQRVYCVGRRAPLQQHPKLVVHTTADFNSWLCPEPADVFIALGTTIAAAGSRDAFRAIDLTAVVAVARSTRAAGANRLGVVSAMGADPESRVFYNRVKGEMEAGISALGFDRLVIARPSLLAGDRAALHQAPRGAEKLSMAVMQRVNPLLPPNWQSITASEVAQALVTTVQTTSIGRTVLQSGELKRLAQH